MEQVAHAGEARGTRERGVLALLLRFPRAFLAVLCLALYVPGWFTLPPLDRDESRFAQASKEMLETRDFIGIHYQIGQRNKKPAGIHWLQAASAALAGGPQKAGIWAYRLPSVAGALAAVLTLFTLFAPLVGRRTAFIGAGLTAATVSLCAEANISKTDAVLLLTVVAAQGPLLKAYLEARADDWRRLHWGDAFIFWLAISGGLLIKGPIQPMVVGLTAVTLSLADRNWRWLLKLRPIPGLVMTALLVLPWGIAIIFDTEGRFYREAVGTDFLEKIFRGMESHGAPPGYYVTLGFLTFWPATLLVIPAAIRAWRLRREPLTRFMLAWAIPSLIVFELVMTKLPHYSLPTYPAFAMMVALGLAAWTRAGDPGPGRIAGGVSLGLWVLAAGSLVAGLVYLATVYGDGVGIAMGAGLVALVGLAGLVAAFALQRRYEPAVLASIAAGVVFIVTAFELTVPRLSDLDVSRRLATAAREASGEAHPAIASTGYAEPSLVFLTGTKTLLAAPEAVAAFLAETPRGIAIVEAREEKDFLAAARGLGLDPMPAGRVDGHAYSNGRDVHLTLYRAGGAP